MASGKGVAEKARRLLHRQGLPVPGGADFHAGHVFDAARTGQAWAEQIVGETVDYLSLAFASLAMILDPEVAPIYSAG